MKPNRTTANDPRMNPLVFIQAANRELAVVASARHLGRPPDLLSFRQFHFKEKPTFNQGLHRLQRFFSDMEFCGTNVWKAGRRFKSLRPQIKNNAAGNGIFVRLHVDCMRAMILEKPQIPLRESEVATPSPGAGQVLVRVLACAVCRTDLHVVDGELPNPKLPLIPGHEIVGEVVECGPQVEQLAVGTRVGIPWLGWTCGRCEYCQANRENLCDNARFTGYTIDGGYAEFTVAEAAFCFPLDESYGDVEAAPLLCAGLIGYRSLVMAGSVQEATHLGIYGFGGAAHIIAQVAIHEGRQVYAFTRPGKRTDQVFARSLGAIWAGGSDELPPHPLDAVIIFAPVGTLVVAALRVVRKGCRVICGGIHMSDIPSFPYSLLWEERSVHTVANLTRADARSFLSLAPKVPVRTETESFWMSNANEALDRLRSGRIHGVAVLVPNW